MKYFVRIKKYSRRAGRQIFVIYGQPMYSNIIISYVYVLRCKISYLYTKICPDQNKERYLKPSKSRAISFDPRLNITILHIPYERSLWSPLIKFWPSPLGVWPSWWTPLTLETLEAFWIKIGFLPLLSPTPFFGVWNLPRLTPLPLRSAGIYMVCV